MLQVLLTTLLTLLPGADLSEGRVTWKGRTHDVEKLPANMPVPAAEAVGQWAAWAKRKGYRLTLDADGLVLFVSARGPTREMQLAKKTVALFERSLPAPPRETVAGRPLSAGGDRIPEDPDDVIPEDPDDDGDGDAGRPDALARALYGWTEQWGAGSQELDRDTVVLLILEGEDDYSDAIDHVVELAPYLGVWAGDARDNLGFMLERPLCGAWVMGGAGQEEWHPDAELVHRLSELLLARRFGRQPYWVSQGWAWHAETELRGSIYCYPYRAEFIYVTEHTAWPQDLAKLAAEHGDVEMGAISALVRGQWNGRAARLAFGAISWLARERQDQLPALLEDLRLAWSEGNRVDLGGGDWERDPDWEVPLEEQQAIFLRRAGADFFAALTAGLLGE